MYNTMISNHSLLILCANLPRRKDRRFVMENQLPTVLDQSVTIFPAVDGDAIPKWKPKRLHQEATPSGYAVRLTKRCALRRFLRSGKDFLLYLEDDVVVTEEFDETVKEAMTLGRELVFLGGGNRTAPKEDGRWLKCQTYNNHALLFSRVGALKALKILSQWREAWSDRELQRATKDGRLDAWCPSEWVAFQRQTSSDNWGNTHCISLAQVAQPMMLPDDLAVLDAALNFCKVVVEYGSGGSTLHLGSRLQGWGRLVSIEHNREWYDRVRSQLDQHEFPVEYVLKEPRPLREGDGPWRFLPGQMDDYVKAPSSNMKEGEADLVFVDGRERIRCALECVSLLKPGGLLMIHDFFSRSHYRARLSELLTHYDFLFDTPESKKGDPQGLAVFRRKSV